MAGETASQAVQVLPIVVSNSAAWFSAAAALVSSIAACISFGLNRINNIGVIGISNVDVNLDHAINQITYTLKFTVKNYGDEKINLISATTKTFIPGSRQMVAEPTRKGGFEYFQGSDSLKINVTKVINSIPKGINLTLNKQINQETMHKSMSEYAKLFPKHIVIIEFEYAARKYLRMRNVKVTYFYEADLSNVGPASLEEYPELKEIYSKTR